MQSLTIYRGPSMLDGREIVASLTFHSANAKTGNMAQLYIMSAQSSPLNAFRLGHNRAVCGHCPVMNACYVDLGRGVTSTWRSAMQRTAGLWPALARLRVFAAANPGRAVLRFGAYGDPTALPRAVIECLSSAAGGRHTGYTHQWRDERHGWASRYFMASVETARDALIARSKGWRTFRIQPKGEAPGRGEVLCVNESRDVQCRDCGLCRGSSLAAKSITIHVHGFRKGTADAVINKLRSEADFPPTTPEGEGES